MTPGKVLVLVKLNGGNDGLNTVIPKNQLSNLSKARPHVFIPENKVIDLGEKDLGLHPELTGFKSLFDEQRLKIIQNVGYETPDFSHFRSMDIWESLWEEEELPPLVMISFSSGPGSWYRGNWEKFVVDELPNWAAKKFNTRTDRDGSLLTGVSMGGYGALKIGFKYPERFKAIAPMEPAIEPSIHREEGNKRNTWYRMEAMEEMAWGSPFNESAWLEDNPATIVSKNADLIRNSGLDIYLEVGDKDYINLHDGAEYMHRILLGQ